MLNMEDTSLQLTPEAPFDGNATVNIVATKDETVKQELTSGDTELDYRFSAEDEQYADGPEIDQQKAVEELRKREEAEYGEFKARSALANPSSPYQAKNQT